MDLLAELEWRGLIQDISADLPAALKAETLTAYAGFDPTASSLHVGSLMPILMLARFQRAGHRVIAVVGGGTGMIGDPSGKTQERQLLSVEDVDRNVRGIREQIERYVDFSGPGAAAMIDNAEWLRSARLIDFLRDVGKHFSVSAMLAKESVRRRIDSEQGISFTEFTYSLLQAWDYKVLFERHGCNLQFGGSDQWGNITAGIDLVRRMDQGKAHGLTFPLLTTAAGTKFGKTEAGTIWLAADRTSPYRFYQYFLGVDDRDVAKLLRFLTFLPEPEINALVLATQEAPEKREAHRALARELTRMTHGPAALDRAEQISQIFFGGELAKLSADEILDVLGDAPSSTVAAEKLAAGVDLWELLVASGLAASKGEARRAVEGGGLSLNGARITELARKLTRADAMDGRFFLFRKGKKDYHVVRIA